MHVLIDLIIKLISGPENRGSESLVMGENSWSTSIKARSAVTCLLDDSLTAINLAMTCCNDLPSSLVCREENNDDELDQHKVDHSSNTVPLTHGLCIHKRFKDSKGKKEHTPQIVACTLQCN